MTDISKEALDALSAELHEWSEYEAAEMLVALRAALDEAEARAEKAEAERDAANALLRAFASVVGGYEADMHPMTRDMFNRVISRLGAKP